MRELNESETQLIYQSMLNELTLKELEKAFPSLFNKYVDYYTNNNINSILPKDIIIYILGFTDLNDTLKVSLVCKLWNNVLYEPRFWTNRIQKRIYQLELPDHVKEIILKSNFFIGDMKFLALKQRLDFLFINKIHIYNHIDYSRSWVEIINREKTHRQSFDSQSVQHEEIIVLGLGEGINYKVKRNGTIKTYVNDSNLKYYSFYEKDKVHSETASCHFVYQNGMSYQGDAILTTYRKHLQPHGKGLWTFPDQTTLSGDNVACNGVPHGGNYFMGMRFENENEKRFLHERYFKPVP